MLSDLGKRPELSKHKFNARINKEKDCLHRNILHTDVKLHTHVTHIFQRKKKWKEGKQTEKIYATNTRNRGSVFL